MTRPISLHLHARPRVPTLKPDLRLALASRNTSTALAQRALPTNPVTSGVHAGIALASVPTARYILVPIHLGRPPWNLDDRFIWYVFHFMDIVVD